MHNAVVNIKPTTHVKHKNTEELNINQLWKEKYHNSLFHFKYKLIKALLMYSWSYIDYNKKIISAKAFIRHCAYDRCRNIFKNK
jgi:hypothetical protein